MRSCYLLALFSLVSLVAGDPGSAAIGAAENIFEVINGRGQFAEIQRIMSEQVCVVVAPHNYLWFFLLFSFTN